MKFNKLNLEILEFVRLGRRQMKSRLLVPFRVTAKEGKVREFTRDFILKVNLKNPSVGSRLGNRLCPFLWTYLAGYLGFFEYGK